MSEWGGVNALLLIVLRITSIIPIQEAPLFLQDQSGEVVRHVG